MDDCLLPHHRELLERHSAIEPAVIRDRGYVSVTTPDELARLGIQPRDHRVPALVLPLSTVWGERGGIDVRPDEFGWRKYVTTPDAKAIIDVPPRCFPRLRDPRTPLWVVDGTKKADAAASRGLCAISITTAVRGNPGLDCADVVAQWNEIPIADRVVYIAWDSDCIYPRRPWLSVLGLSRACATAGARVRIVHLKPFAPGTRPELGDYPHADGSKCGLDDYFATGGTVSRLIKTRSAPFTLNRFQPEQSFAEWIQNMERLGEVA